MMPTPQRARSSEEEVGERRPLRRFFSIEGEKVRGLVEASFHFSPRFPPLLSRQSRTLLVLDLGLDVLDRVGL